MIISVTEAKELISGLDKWTDAKIERKLKAIEQTIRSYTHNNFQDRDCRRTADIVGGSLYVEALTPFEVGDTVMITETTMNKGLFTVKEVEDTYFTVNEAVDDEQDVLITKVFYPEDVVDCCVNLMEWEKDNRKKVGIKSETISRHSVTYEDSSSMYKGYPIGILNALDSKKKARF